jgi:hypothetical protein
MAEITNHQAGTAATGLGGGCAALFGSIFILAGIGIGLFLYFPAIGGWWVARSWEEVPCRIESAELAASHGDDSTTYEAKAAYRYDYQGRSFRSEQVSLMGGSDNFGDFQQRHYDELRLAREQDRPFRCLVNPAQPGEAILFNDLRWGLLLMMSLFPTLFPLAGGFVAVGGIAMAREGIKIMARQRKYPDQPWHWKLEWTDGKVTASGDGSKALLAVAAWIMLIQAPLAIAVVMSGALAESLLAALAFLPLAIAFFPLRAVWSRMKTKRLIGVVSLEPRQWPLRPGEVLEGRLRFSQALSPQVPLSVRTRAIRKVTRGSGKSTSTSEETLWEHTEALSAAEVQREDRGCALPLRIELPLDLPGTSMGPLMSVSHERSEHLWSMEVMAGEGTKPATLPLPVFGEAREEVRVASAAVVAKPVIEEDLTEQLLARLQARGIQASFNADGTPESLTCPPGRNRGIAIFLFFFGTIWMGAMIMIFAQNAPLIFKLIWGLSAPAILLLAVYLLLHSRRLQLSGSTMTLTNRVGPFFSKTETFESRHIVQFMHDNYLRSGNVHFYRLRLETTFGKKLTLADGLTEEATAQKLANRLMKWKRAME